MDRSLCSVGRCFTRRRLVARSVFTKSERVTFHPIKCNEMHAHYVEPAQLSPTRRWRQWSCDNAHDRTYDNNAAATAVAYWQPLWLLTLSGTGHWRALAQWRSGYTLVSANNCQGTNSNSHSAPSPLLANQQWPMNNSSYEKDNRATRTATVLFSLRKFSSLDSDKWNLMCLMLDGICYKETAMLSCYL